MLEEVAVLKVSHGGLEDQQAKTVMASRPTHFRSADQVYTYCTQELPKEKCFAPIEDDSLSVEITTWPEQICIAVEEHDMDTVLHIYNAKDQAEAYMLDHETWGHMDTSGVEAWVEELQNRVHRDGTNKNPQDVCRFDIENLELTGKYIMNSLTVDLWNIIEKEVGANVDEPTALHAIVQQAQVSTASMVQKLTGQLKEMSLKHEPGQNVVNFSAKITTIAWKIGGSIISVPNLNCLVIAPYLNCGVEQFCLFAIQLHAEADCASAVGLVTIKSTTRSSRVKPAWDKSVTQLNVRFCKLCEQDLWTPLAKTKQDEQHQAMQA